MACKILTKEWSDLSVPTKASWIFFLKRTLLSGVAISQSITSCHRNDMTTCNIALGCWHITSPRLPWQRYIFYGHKIQCNSHMTRRILYFWSFHMKLMKDAEGSLQSFHTSKHWQHWCITKTCLFKYTEILTTKKLKLLDKKKKIWYFSYFCSKHRLWVLIRTASTRWF